MTFTVSLNGKDVLVSHPSSPEPKVLPGWTWHAELVRQLIDEREELIAKLSSACDVICDLGGEFREPDMDEARRRAEDAERYRWLRRRVRLASQQMMSGAIKQWLTVRLAYSAVDRTDDPADSYLSQDRFDRDCADLDAAIDAARKVTS
jgi:hypothetical protein